MLSAQKDFIVVLVHPPRRLVQPEVSPPLVGPVVCLHAKIVPQVLTVKLLLPSLPLAQQARTTAWMVPLQLLNVLLALPAFIACLPRQPLLPAIQERILMPRMPLLVQLVSLVQLASIVFPILRPPFHVLQVNIPHWWVLTRSWPVKPAPQAPIA